MTALMIIVSLVACASLLYLGMEALDRWQISRYGFELIEANWVAAKGNEQVLKLRRRDGMEVVLCTDGYSYWDSLGKKAGRAQRNAILEASRRYNYKLYIKNAEMLKAQGSKYNQDLLSALLSTTGSAALVPPASGGGTGGGGLVN